MTEPTRLPLALRIAALERRVEALEKTITRSLGALERAVDHICIIDTRLKALEEAAVVTRRKTPAKNPV